MRFADVIELGGLFLIIYFMALAFTKDTFSADVLKSPVPVLVDFWAPWCGPCKIIGPIVEEVAKQYDGKAVKIGKLNVDEHAAVASQYGVMSIPTLMIFKNGVPVAQMVGVQSKDKIMDALEKAMA